MKNKPEFQLAASIFIAMSVIGTAFGLWWASRYADVRPRTVTTPAAESAAPMPDEGRPPAPDRPAQ